MINEKIVRYSDNLLLIIDKQNKLNQFINVNNQYIPHSTEQNKLYDNFVWATTNNKTFINKIFTSEKYDFVNNADNFPIENHKFTTYTLYVRQGYDFNKFFGFLVAIVNQDGTFRYCQLIEPKSFTFNNGGSDKMERRKINNDYWTLQYSFDIPSIVDDKNLFISILPVKYNTDIEMDYNLPVFGKLYNFESLKNNLEPIIYQKQLPDTVQVQILREGSFLKIQPINTDKTKTIEQELIDYLGIERNVIHNIKINHQISYGLKSQPNGYVVVNVENVENNYEPIYYVPYIPKSMYDVEDENIEVVVQTEFNVNNTQQMIRTSTIILEKTNDILHNTIFDKVKNATFQPIKLDVNDETIVQNNIIETKTNTEFININKHIYVDMVKNDEILFENKIVGFQDIINNRNSVYTLTITNPKNKDDNFELNNIDRQSTYVMFDFTAIKNIKKLSELLKEFKQGVPFEINEYRNALNPILIRKGTITSYEKIITP